MATLRPPQVQLRPGGQAHELSGRPGFRTGTMTRSLAWLHLVERCPRIQGVHAIFLPSIKGILTNLLQRVEYLSEIVGTVDPQRGRGRCELLMTLDQEQKE